MIIYRPYKKVKTLAITESVSNVFDAFRKVFSSSVINSEEMLFEYDSVNIFQVFNVLNNHFFDSRLNPIQFAICTREDFKEILSMMNKRCEDDYYAAYIPQYKNIKGQTQKETIFIIEGYGKMTFKFAVSCMLHEMIHYYDTHYGQLKQIIKQNRYVEDVEHYTPTFIHISNIAESEGLKIMKSGNQKSFERLNAEIAGFKPLTEEEMEANWKDLVSRLKTGEDIPGVALTPTGNVAYLFLD